MPGASLAPATSAISASLTTSTRDVPRDAPHDGADGPRFVVAIDAGDAETDRGRRDVAIADRRFHHLVQDLLDARARRRCEGSRRAAPFGDDRPLRVGEQTHRLRPAGVDAEHVHGAHLTRWRARPSVLPLTGLSRPWS